MQLPSSVACLREMVLQRYGNVSFAHLFAVGGSGVAARLVHRAMTNAIKVMQFLLQGVRNLLRDLSRNVDK